MGSEMCIRDRSPAVTNGTQTGAIPSYANIWHHVAYVRRSGVFHIFVDGVCLARDADHTSVNISGTTNFYIGRNHLAIASRTGNIPVIKQRNEKMDSTCQDTSKTSVSTAARRYTSIVIL